MHHEHHPQFKTPKPQVTLHMQQEYRHSLRLLSRKLP
jgi:hypothetical protein